MVFPSLNPSDLNTDFADNSNWYDDICDGRVMARICHRDSGEVYDLTDKESSAWVASAPPDYAPQIQPISTMFDLVTGAADDESNGVSGFSNDVSFVQNAMGNG